MRVTCLLSPARYLETVWVSVEARVLGLIRGVEPGQTYIPAEYRSGGPAGFHRASRRPSVQPGRNLAVLRGYISDGPVVADRGRRS